MKIIKYYTIILNTTTLFPAPPNVTPPLTIKTIALFIARLLLNVQDKLVVGVVLVFLNNINIFWKRYFMYKNMDNKKPVIYYSRHFIKERFVPKYVLSVYC